jgi:DNA-binding MarR family transcriptional regulator
MDVSYLRVFFEVAKLGRFSEAAQRLRISQSALSRSVSLLEESEGVKLFERSKKGVTLTPVGEEVFRRATSNTSDLAGNPRMQANALMGALRDEPALIRRATGRSGNALADILEPDQLNLLRAVAGETDRAAAVASAGNGPGSATAQRMAAQNVLRQIIGPTGLPQSWSENALANTVVGKPLNLIYGGIAEPRIQQELARAILDPDSARAVLAVARAQGVNLPPSTMMQLLLAASRSAAPAAAISGQR